MIACQTSFIDQVTRVVHSACTGAPLSHRTSPDEVKGVWRDLIDKLHTMATNLSLRTTTISKVITAVARGDLSKKLTFHAEGAPQNKTQKKENQIKSNQIKENQIQPIN